MKEFGTIFYQLKRKTNFNITLNGYCHVVVPQLITGTISNPTFSTWKLGTAINEGNLVLDTTKFIEVEINGQIYAVALATI